MDEVIYLVRNGKTADEDGYEYLAVDAGNTDDKFWRGYTFDGHFVGRSKTEYYTVPEPKSNWGWDD